MNAVLLSLAVLFIISLFRIQVVFALLVAAAVGGIAGGLSWATTIETFTTGLADSATIAVSYALLGAFAAGLTETGLPSQLVHGARKLLGRSTQDGSSRRTTIIVLMLLAVAFIASLSQNVVPIHIAFIPILIPPMLVIWNEMRVDRRAVASALTFGLIMPYMLIPAGFGAIFHDIVAENMTQNGLAVDASLLPQAMWIPALGMFAGLLVAIGVSYRRPRSYTSAAAAQATVAAVDERDSSAAQLPGARWRTVAGIASIAAMLATQLATGSMIAGAGAGLGVLLLARLMTRQRAERVFTDGMRSMSYIGFVMMSAAGLAAVLRATGDIDALVQTSVAYVGDSRAIAVILMLLIGLLVTMGIGSSFSTIPLIATVFVPLCMELGFSPLATISLIGTAAALGDAGSPASDSTLGPTAGLNADGQHDHIWDTCVPTFLHYNIPLLIFGFIAAMVL
ncbi:Na+/H+ antiporter family protein [Paenibacillus arenosi]|uniref:Sodium:proton antiporter n=1 Tax=Paenibacillus arenosi TaxID=2774142 RepID=A0ABR9AY67_9BACL|nr:Na+/H+ antiporter NhaC family protein [Paenibacillus arenosi]MBD8498140.1 sodium:proton antiporter [Paenibacillus arenosi]